MTENERRFITGTGPEPHTYLLARDPIDTGRDAGSFRPAEGCLPYNLREDCEPTSGKGTLSRPALPGGAR